MTEAFIPLSSTFSHFIGFWQGGQVQVGRFSHLRQILKPNFADLALSSKIAV
jgi:hypothetical protein